MLVSKLQGDKKEHILIGGQTLHVCLSEYTVTDHGSILAVNKFYAYCFVNCNLQFQAFPHSKQHSLQIYIQINSSKS